jgi:hypothetical protein
MKDEDRLAAASDCSDADDISQRNGKGEPPGDEALAQAATAEKRSPTQATQLVRLAEERFRVGRSPEGDLFAVPRIGPPIVRMLRGSGSSLRAALADAYAAERDAAPSATALANALLVLEGRALRVAAEPLALRVANYGSGIVLDLGDETGRAVVVGDGSWRVVGSPPILFRRTALTLPLPTPVRGGSLDDLRDLVRIADETWPLAVGWLLITLLPNVPAPILFFRGAQGAGKSSAARLLSRLVDPSAAQLRATPRDPSDWTITAGASRVVPLDNLSRIPEWLGDALCRVVTGEGLARRALYTDSDMIVFSFKRAVMLTAIAVDGVRGDLADRLLPVELERIDERSRRTEAELEAAFQAAHPRVLGALLDLLARVVDILPDTHPDRLPRLADAGRVFAAMDAIEQTRAFDAFCGIAGRLAHEVVEDDAVADAIRTLMESRASWEGTTAELLAAITPNERPRGWPGSPQALTSRLTRSEEALRLLGIRLERGQTGKGAARRRFVRLTADEGQAPESSASSASAGMAQQSGGTVSERGVRRPDEHAAPPNEADEGRTSLVVPSSDRGRALGDAPRASDADEADEGSGPSFTCEGGDPPYTPAWVAAAGGTRG